MNLPRHRRPPECGGTGKDPVWCIDAAELGQQLRFRPGPANPGGHGFVEPAERMTLDEYQEAIAATRAAWRRAAC